MKLKPIEDQVVVITGASSGIGRATALRLAKRGAKVVVSSRSQSGLDSLVEEIRYHAGEAIAVTADVGVYREVKQLADTAVEKYGRIDTWVHAAAVLLNARFDQTTPEEYERVIRINLLGQVHGAMAALPYLKREGRGAIIHVSSVEARRTFPLHSAYGSAKHGITGMVEALRVELAHDGIPISVTEILPGSINTPLYMNAKTKIGVQPAAPPPVYQPEIVADAIVYAAEHPTREIIVGGAGKMIVQTQALAPRVLDLISQAFGFALQKTNQPKSPDDPNNLWTPVPEHDRVHGDLKTLLLSGSAYTWLQKHPVIKYSGVGMLATGAVGVLALNSLKWTLMASALRFGGKASIWAIKRKLG